jgi:hypothetical protein
MMIVSWLSFLPIIDLLAAAYWFRTVMKEWKDVDPRLEEKDVNERSLGATVIMGQLNAVITGSSIIIAGIAAFVALGKTGIVYPQNFHLFYASVWAVFALVLAQYAMGTLPTRTRKQNFVSSSGVALLCAMALFFSLFAGIRLLFGIAWFLFSANTPQLPS